MKSLNIITDVIKPEFCCTTLRSHPLSAISQDKIAFRYFAISGNMKTVGIPFVFTSQVYLEAYAMFRWPWLMFLQSSESDPLSLGKRWPSKWVLCYYCCNPIVIGAVDGTHVRSIAPSEHESVSINRKKNSFHQHPGNMWSWRWISNVLIYPKISEITD